MGLDALGIDPVATAQAYRERIVGRYACCSVTCPRHHISVFVLGVGDDANVLHRTTGTTASAVILWTGYNNPDSLGSLDTANAAFTGRRERRLSALVAPTPRSHQVARDKVVQ